MVRRLEVLDLQVMRVMTGLRQSPERLLALQLRANGCKIKSRRSLQRSLDRLQKERVLVRDASARVWVVDFKQAKEWCEAAREQERLRASLLSNIEDHVQLGGSPIYRWVKEAKVPRGRG